MPKSTLPVRLEQETNAINPLTAMLRTGAQQLIAQAVEAELQIFLAQYADKKLADGRNAIVHNGYLPERSSVDRHW